MNNKLDMFNHFCCTLCLKGASQPSYKNMPGSITDEDHLTRETDCPERQEPRRITASGLRDMYENIGCIILTTSNKILKIRHNICCHTLRKLHMSITAWWPIAVKMDNMILVKFVNSAICLIVVELLLSYLNRFQWSQVGYHALRDHWQLAFWGDNFHCWRHN